MRSSPGSAAPPRGAAARGRGPAASGRRERGTGRGGRYSEIAVLRLLLPQQEARGAGLSQEVDTAAQRLLLSPSQAVAQVSSPLSGPGASAEHPLAAGGRWRPGQAVAAARRPRRPRARRCLGDGGSDPLRPGVPCAEPGREAEVRVGVDSAARARLRCLQERGPG